MILFSRFTLIHFAFGSTQSCGKTSLWIPDTNDGGGGGFKHPSNYGSTACGSTLSQMLCICDWLHRYSETVKCFLHYETNLQINKQNEENYFKRNKETFYDYYSKHSLLWLAVATKENEILANSLWIIIIYYCEYYLLWKCLLE